MKSVLIVEDDEDLRDMYAEVLKINGYMVQTAIDGADGIDKYQKNMPDLVLMDSDMPNVSGIEAYAKIREFDKNARVVIITGYNPQKTTRPEQTEGILSFVSKPIGMEKLLELTSKYIKN